MKIRKQGDSDKTSDRRSTRLLLILGVAALVLFFPYKTTVVPEWKIKVVDERGRPFADVRVAQQWDHYSYRIGAIEEQYSDENGYVVFPERTVRVGLLYRFLRSCLAILLTLAHGSTGAQATVWATTPESVSEFIKYEPGKPLVKEIILRR